MAEKRTRRSFTREFKAQAVKRLLDGGRGLSEVATELGLSTGQLSTWRSEHLAAGSPARLRGYPVEGDFDRRADDLSVDHPQVVQHYREARAAGLAATRTRPSSPFGAVASKTKIVPCLSSATACGSHRPGRIGNSKALGAPVPEIPTASGSDPSGPSSPASASGCSPARSTTAPRTC